MNRRSCWMQICICVFGFLAASCDSFNDVGLPKSQLASDAVFEDVTTANAAMANVYARLRDNGLLTGNPSGMTITLGHYADEFTFYGSPANASAPFDGNNLIATNNTVRNLWNDSYNQIYAANSIVEGVGRSASLPEADRERLQGEALLVRAMIHFCVANLYGDIPYIKSTDYEINRSVSRMPVAEIYDVAIADIEEAIDLLPEEYSSPERVIPNKKVAQALLSRVLLYAGKWAEAENSASAILNDSGTFTWEPNLGLVFLKESTTTIWQFSPATPGRNTWEASNLIFNSGPPPLRSLSASLIEVFEPGDLRHQLWTRSVTNGTSTWFHAYKYKQNAATPESTEYSIVFRLSEQYLIRAEARARQGELTTALEDLNFIRNAAGLADIIVPTQSEVLSAILRERRVEFFAESGHRFFDLKRYGLLDATLSPLKPGWNSTDMLFPLPEAELLANSNIEPQNPGY